MFSFSCTKERENEVPFSMAMGNMELMHECFPKHSRREQQESNKTIIRLTKTVRERREYGKKKSRHESPDSLSLPNQIIILINIKCYYFKRYGKKYNEIQLTWNKVDLNNRYLMTNHPPSPVTVLPNKEFLVSRGRATKDEQLFGWCTLENKWRR